MRCFVAAELPPERAAGIAAWAARATGRDPALRLVAIDALHMTLAFIGSMSPDDVGRVEQALRDAVAETSWPSDLRLGEPLWLSPQRPHVLALGIGDGRDLAALQARVAAGLAEAIGLAPETRPFLAHVTVARIGRGRAPRSHDVAAPPPGEAFAPDAVALMRSTLAPAGARYETLVRVSGHD